MTIRTLLDELSRRLRDVERRQWDETVLTSAVNAAFAALCDTVPSAHTVEADHVLKAGTSQTIPDTYHRLFRVLHAVNADGTPGKPVTRVDPAVLDTAAPTWRADEPREYVRHWMQSDLEERRFDVWPQASIAHVCPPEPVVPAKPVDPGALSAGTTQAQIDAYTVAKAAYDTALEAKYRWDADCKCNVTMPVPVAPTGTVAAPTPTPVFQAARLSDTDKHVSITLDSAKKTATATSSGYVNGAADVKMAGDSASTYYWETQLKAATGTLGSEDVGVGISSYQTVANVSSYLGSGGNADQAILFQPAGAYASGSFTWPLPVSIAAGDVLRHIVQFPTGRYFVAVNGGPFTLVKTIAKTGVSYLPAYSFRAPGQVVFRFASSDFGYPLPSGAKVLGGTSTPPNPNAPNIATGGYYAKSSIIQAPVSGDGLLIVEDPTRTAAESMVVGQTYDIYVEIPSGKTGTVSINTVIYPDYSGFGGNFVGASNAPLWSDLAPGDVIRIQHNGGTYTYIGKNLYSPGSVQSVVDPAAQTLYKELESLAATCKARPAPSVLHCVFTQVPMITQGTSAGVRPNVPVKPTKPTDPGPVGLGADTVRLFTSHVRDGGGQQLLDHYPGKVSETVSDETIDFVYSVKNWSAGSASLYGTYALGLTRTTYPASYSGSVVNVSDIFENSTRLLRNDPRLKEGAILRVQITRLGAISLVGIDIRKSGTTQADRDAYLVASGKYASELEAFRAATIAAAQWDAQNTGKIGVTKPTEPTDPGPVGTGRTNAPLRASYLANNFNVNYGLGVISLDHPDSTSIGTGNDFYLTVPDGLSAASGEVFVSGNYHQTSRASFVGSYNRLKENGTQIVWSDPRIVPGAILHIRGDALLSVNTYNVGVTQTQVDAYTEAKAAYDAALKVYDAAVKGVALHVANTALTLDSELPVDKFYRQALMEYALFYCYSVDDDMTANSHRSNQHLQNFYQLLNHTEDTVVAVTDASMESER